MFYEVVVFPFLNLHRRGKKALIKPFSICKIWSSICKHIYS